MPKSAEFQNVFDDSLTSDTNTSNTNANKSITTKSRESTISLEFDEEVKDEELYGIVSTKSNNIVDLFTNENQSFANTRHSTTDDTFRYQTKLRNCNVESDNTNHLFSVSRYSVGSSIFSAISGPLMAGNDDQNINLDESGETTSIFHKNTETVKKNNYQDCKCEEEARNEIINVNSIEKVTYTVSDDLGSIPKLSVIDELIPDYTSTNHSMSDLTDIEKFENNQLIYFTPDEVVIHNQPNDLWVSYLGNVYDLTPLIEKQKGTREIKPLLAFAGKDISDWFDENGDLRHHIHPMTGVRVPYLPHGPIPDIRPHVPTTKWQPMCACTMNEHDRRESFRPWWRCRRYFIGKLTKCARPIRIINMLTLDECTLNVCCEDTINRILERLLMFNSHGKSYTFKYDTRVLDMNKTLDENHIFDERETYLMNYLPEDTYIPVIHLYFNDDFKWDLNTSDECDDD